MAGNSSIFKLRLETGPIDGRIWAGLPVKRTTRSHYFQRRYARTIKHRAIEADTEAQLAALEQTLRSEIAIAGD